jgi:murein DD-endopeptidase MepM/ murein hydrolase activator NlpD
MKIYTVRKGDTLWNIARAHTVSVQAIASANKLKGRRLHLLSIDQTLLIPDPQVKPKDTSLTVGFRALDFSPVSPKLVKFEYDGRTEERLIKDANPISLFIDDHARGLKIWVQDIEKKLEKTFSVDVLPLGNWHLNIDSRKVKADGKTQPQKGKATTTSTELNKNAVHNAQVQRGTAAHQQARIETGQPRHAVASIYTAANLRLPPANEKYRAELVAAAGRHGLTPQSLAALLDAEAAKNRKTGEWLERSNAAYPDRAQGLAQFFEAAWTDVKNRSASLLHAECQKLSKRDLLAKRLVARYAIDSAAAYAVMNLENFAKRTGMPIASLAPEDKAKVAYFLHHEGLSGALRTLQLCGESRTPAQAKERLIGQFGKDNIEKVEKLIQQYDEDPIKAYKGWLFTYTDAKINVNAYIVNDVKKFEAAPRSMADIFAGLSGQAAPIKPAPRAPQSQPAPPKPPAPRPTTHAHGAPSWHPPLASCTLRTAGLSSKGAQFGWTRQGGKRVHQGIDLIAVPGTPIVAVADGFVYKRQAKSPSVAYGDTLVLVVAVDDLPEPQASICAKIAPGRNHIGFFYAHLSEVIEGKNPVPVAAGTVIGKTGDSGNAKGMNTIAKGAHLHFEVRLDPLKIAPGLNNRADPLPFITGSTQ